jgi:hypothetical protein
MSNNIPHIILPVFMTYLQNKFHMLRSYSSLVIAVKPQTKKRPISRGRHVVSYCRSNYFNKVSYFSKLFLPHKISGFHASTLVVPLCRSFLTLSNGRHVCIFNSMVGN